MLRRLRHVAFLATALALLGLALLLAGSPGHHPGQLPAATPPSLGRIPAREAATAEHPLRTRLVASARLAARRFLAAFSRYEVGELTPRIRRALRRSATRAFASQLLAAPPRPLGIAPPRRAHPASIEVTLIDPAGLSAQVSGLARRGHRSEPLSFLFRRTRTGWRATDIAE
jgi:hypothetical protein